jgi:DNA-binding CsgD family transcriptional regulator
MALERLLALFAAKDLDALIDTAFHTLGATVACDFASAFYRSTGDGLFKQRDSRGREYGPALMRRYMELTPALQIAMTNRGIKILPTSTGLPRSVVALKRTAFYREIMQPQGWRHAVALCFWGDPPATSPVFVTSVYRGQGQSDFSEQDIGKLACLHPFIDSAVNRVHEREAATTIRDGMALAVHDGMRGLAILDRHLLLVQANQVARQLCAAWVDDGTARHTEDSSATWCLPTVLESECRELDDEWQSLVRADPDAADLRRHRQVVHARVPGLTASITMICPSTAGLAEPTFVLEFDRRVHGVALETPDGSVPVLQKLTAAERAVALVLADGFSNQEIADRLGKSVHAVKFLLHRIYEKTGVPNRAALVAVLRSRRRSRQHAS